MALNFDPARLARLDDSHVECPHCKRPLKIVGEVELRTGHDIIADFRNLPTLPVELHMCPECGLIELFG